MDLGSTIYKYRKQAGLSQEELANKLNVTRQSVSLWETNQAQPSLDNLKSLSKIFNITLDLLCANESKDNSKIISINKDDNEVSITASIIYEKSIYERIYNKTFRKNIYSGIILSILCLIIAISIIVFIENNIIALVPLLLSVLFISIVIKIKKNIKRTIDNVLKTRPNAKSDYYFYKDGFKTVSKTDNTSSNYFVKYNEISNISQDNEYIYLIFNQMFAVIDKSTCKENIDNISELLKVKKTLNKVNSKINKLLILFFVLSLVSIVIALLIVAISSSFSPLPEFPFSMPEHMWKFYLVLPIPLTSIVLGIIYLIKGYKCKKNIIAGAIMSVVLIIYGSFTVIFADSINHDIAYLNNISDQMNFEFPNSGYISITYEYNQNYESLAMVKVNENEVDSFVEKLDKSGYYHNDTSFIPSNVLDVYTLSLTTDYEYFTIYNLTTNTYNDFNGKLIYVAYDIDKSILFICCYK